MARNNKSNKENIPLGKPKTGKSSKGNLFELLEGKTGNPTNAKEFDEDAHGDDEVFFKTDPEVAEEDKQVRSPRLLTSFLIPHPHLHHVKPEAVKSTWHFLRVVASQQPHFPPR